MKKTIGLLASSAIVAMLALPAFCVVASLQPEAALQDQCTDEKKAAWYKEFMDVRTKDAAKGYELAKKYLGCSPADDQYTAYLKKWVAAYDKEAHKLQLPDLLYNQKKYPEAYTLGKEILAEDPENLKVLLDLGYGGYLAALAKNESFNADAITYAKKAIQLIEAGKTLEDWAPFKTKDEALAYLHYTIGYLNRKNPAEALTSFIKAVQFESPLKKDPWSYFFIAAGYEGGPYAKLSADYKARFEGKDESPESKLALENINQVVDRMIDAYARAVALAANDPKNQAKKAEWLQGLTTWYKFRHDQSDTGLNEMIASVLSKPLPPEPTPITTLPAATPSTNPASGTGSTSGSNPATGTTPAPAKPDKSSSGSTAPAKPAETPKTSSTSGPTKP
jgi:hypothetical protein